MNIPVPIECTQIRDNYCTRVRKVAYIGRTQTTKKLIKQSISKELRGERSIKKKILVSRRKRAVIGITVSFWQHITNTALLPLQLRCAQT
ncbi:MAG TPA: hypothetical protein DHW71_11710 [Gammaproteobacteria bacterium]|nr:hypothetical protein [Gammaproteobacteria bacterium]HBF07636.1 hypothetical protein [Gammaproteobacteria bacterium]HCK93651.1 hypothetical protein [Gammaproteobacteria bacterium]